MCWPKLMSKDEAKNYLEMMTSNISTLWEWTKVRAADLTVFFF